MLDLLVSYLISALILWRFAGGTLLELGAAIAICWSLLTGLYLMQ